MKPSVLVLALGGFMILIGITGYIRTGSPKIAFDYGSERFALAATLMKRKVFIHWSASANGLHSKIEDGK